MFSWCSLIRSLAPLPARSSSSPGSAGYHGGLDLFAKSKRWSGRQGVQRGLCTAREPPKRACSTRQGSQSAFQYSIGTREQNQSNVRLQRRNFHNAKMLATNSARSTSKRRAFIALGSNIGDRLEMIEKACDEMDQRGIHVLRTSSLWETQPMYVLDQPSFLNGACEIETTLEPIALLDQLQEIEKFLGREKLIDKGPRSIDLDILLYEDEVFTNDRLCIPHKSILEREFVLRPLCELIPNAQFPGDHSSMSLKEHLEKLPPSFPPLSTVTPLSSRQPPLTALQPNRQTHVMAVLNLTPDSFSDGGVHDPTNMEQLKSTILSFISAGATIVDIGGQSTRPGTGDLPEEEELARIIPAIKLTREHRESEDICISVDTYHARVAETALDAGADLINDISAGMLDESMLPALAKRGCSVCLMHMRGTPATMNSLTDYPDGVIPTVARELLARVATAEAAGIRRWRIILDPGIGFAKNEAQNLELLRRMDELRNFQGLQGMPWLVGTSRKRFIGTITGVKDAGQRTWGTAATVTAAIHGGADIVRVHDVSAMAKVVKMADAIYRRQ